MMEIPTYWRVLHDCGHEQVHDLTNKPPGGRNRVASWLARRSCSVCQTALRVELAAKDRREQRRWDRLDEIELWEHRVDMPELYGSVKAATWAREVRFRLLEGAATHFREKGWGETEFILRVELPATEIATASWWIEHRETAAANVEKDVTAGLALIPVRTTGDVKTEQEREKENQ
ncbi:MAG: hypothetical protein WCF25_06710 [Acidimicrobiales bacterium]